MYFQAPPLKRIIVGTPFFPMKQILPRYFALLCALLMGTLRTSAIQVVFSEVMYQPPANKPEFIEIWNITSAPLDTARWTFTNGITFQLWVPSGPFPSRQRTNYSFLGNRRCNSRGLPDHPGGRADLRSLVSRFPEQFRRATHAGG
jgi:hypothetical protein